jgi:hypothetical protein
MNMFCHKVKDILPRVQVLSSANQFRAPITRLFDATLNHIAEHLVAYFGLFIAGKSDSFEIGDRTDIVYVRGFLRGSEFHMGIYQYAIMIY